MAEETDEVKPDAEEVEPADVVEVTRHELVNPHDQPEVYTEEAPGYATFHPQERVTVEDDREVAESSSSVVQEPGDTPDTVPDEQ